MIFLDEKESFFKKTSQFKKKELIMKNIIKSFSKKLYTKFTAYSFNLNNNELLKQEEK